jgi:hypothetical protein
LGPDGGAQRASADGGVAAQGGVALQRILTNGYVVGPGSVGVLLSGRD